MRFSTALVSIFSLSLISGALAAPVHESSSLSARDASFEVSSIETRDEEYDFGDVLEARGKAPKISFALQKGKLNSKDRQLAEEQAEDGTYTPFFRNSPYLKRFIWYIWRILI